MEIRPEDKDKLLDHEYDGIRELDNHLPRWWVWGFYFTIAFSVVYLIYYHLAGGPSSEQEYQQEMAKSPKRQIEMGSTGIVLLKSEDALKAGEGLYTQKACVGCHGPALGGLVGPNLTDDYWIHGCKPEEIAKSIRTGFPEKGMPPYGNNQPMSDVELSQLISFIFSKKGSNPPGAKPIDPKREKACKL